MKTLSTNYIRFDFKSGKFSTHYGMMVSAQDLAYGDQKLGCMNVEYHEFNKSNHGEIINQLIERFKGNNSIVRKKRAFGF